MSRPSEPARDFAIPGNPKQARALIERLRRDGREFSTKLRQLEIHPAYRRLRTTQSTGSTQRVWSHAAALADGLTSQLRAYHTVLDRAAAALSGSRRVARQELTQMTAVLNGAADVRLDDESVGTGVAALMSAMNEAYDVVARTVDDIEECASVVRQRLHSLAETLRGLRARATSLTFRDDVTIGVLDGLERELTDITPAAHADPRGCVLANGDGSGASTPDRLRRLTAGVDNAQARLSTVIRHQTDLQAALVSIRAEIVEVERLELERLSAESMVRNRITGVPDDEESAVPQLWAALARLEQGGTEQAQAETKRSIEVVIDGVAAARERATKRGDAARALLARRDELRGRLSAYRAMAIDLNYAEDLDLAAQYERTYGILWSGPCELAVAADALATYQRAVIERTQQPTPSTTEGETNDRV